MNYTIKVLAFSLFILSTSCKKEGCTDNNADNYNIKAKKNDGTCSYTSSVTFWFNEPTSNWLVSEGTNKIYLEIDGIVLLDLVVTEFNSTAPECASGDALFQRLTFDLGNDYAKSYPLRIKDDLGGLLWSESVVFTGGQCDTYEIVH